jgi:hypothetical protein
VDGAHFLSVSWGALHAATNAAGAVTNERLIRNHAARDEAFERCLLLHKSLHATATAVDDERQRDSLSDVEFDLREQLIFRYARSRVNWVSEHIVLASDLHHRVIVAHEVQQRQELQLHEYRTRETSEHLQLRRTNVPHRRST